MKTPVVLNDSAYGTERSYNGLRLAHALAKRDDEEVRVFLLAARGWKRDTLRAPLDNLHLL